MGTPHATPGDGDVEFMLGAEKIILKPSLAVGLWVSRNGGFLALLDSDSTPMRRLIRLDIDTMAAIIRVAHDKGPNAVPDLEEKIWRQGLDEVSDALQRYLVIVKNGGRPAPKAGGEGSADVRPPGNG